MRLEILDLAKDDLIEGFRFYETKEEGLGNYFLTNLYADIESLRISGGSHRKVFRNLHRSLSNRFPFAIYYTVEEHTVRIRAVVDCRRRPSWILRHIEGDWRRISSQSQSDH